MDDSQLKIVVKAIDEASATLKKISDSTTQMGNTITQATQKSSQSFGDMFKAMLGSQVAFGILQKGFEAAKQFIVDSMKAAEESQRVQAQLYAVLQSTGQAAGVTADAALNLSKALQESTTFSDEQVLSAENMLLTFTKIGKDIFPQATQTVLDMATALGEDTKSAAIQLGKALQDPILGVTALRRVGVSFNEDQVNLIKNLVNTGQSLQAQTYILKELSTEFGGSAANAAETFGGKITQLKNKIDDIQEVIGGAMQASLYTLIGQLSGAATGALGTKEKMHELGYEVYSVTNFIVGLGQAVATVGKTLGVGYNVIKQGVTTVATAATGMVSGFSSVFDNLFGDGKMSQFTEATQNLTYGMVDQLQEGSDKLISSGGDVQKSWEGIGQTMTKTRDDYDNMTKEMENNIQATLKVAKAQETAKASAVALTESQKKHKEAISGLTDEYKKMSTSGKTTLAELADSFRDKMKSINESIESTKNSISDLVSSYSQTQTDNTKSTAEAVVASETKIADIKKQMATAVGQDQYKTLADQLAAEQANYDSAQAFRDANAVAIEEARRRAKETDLQRTIEDYNARAVLDAADYTKRMAQLQKELKSKQDEAAQEQTLYQQKVDAINKIMDDANVYYTKLSDARLKQTTDEVNAEIKLFQALASAISQTKSSTSSSLSTISYPSVAKHESGGFVDAPRGTAVPIIAHGGEMVIPAEQSGRMGGGSNINIVINNPSVRNDSDITNLRKQIDEVLRPLFQNVKIIHS